MATRLSDPPWRGEGRYRMWSLQDRIDTIMDAYETAEKQDRFVDRILKERDIDFFVNTCCDTVNPQEKINKYRPMLLALRQAEFMLFMQRCKNDNQDFSCFKTRKVGVSWMLMQDQAFDYLATPGYSAVIGSYDKDMVDPAGKANMNALFPKLDYTLMSLPSIMKPPGLDDNSPWRVDFLRQNLINGAQIFGQAVTGNFGAGARGGEAVVDEASRCQWAKAGWESAGQTATCRGAVLTPFGKNFGWGLCFPDEYALMTGADMVERPECFRIIWKDIPWINQFLMFPFPVPTFYRKEEYQRWWEENGDKAIATARGYSPFDEIGGAKDGLGIPFGCGYDDGRGNITHFEERMPIQSPPVDAVPEGVLYPWRVIEGFRYDRVGAARELDTQFEESRSGRVYSIQLQSVQRFSEFKRIREYPLYAYCDPGGGTDNAFYLGWVQWHVLRRRYQPLLEIMYEGRDGRFFLPFLSGVEGHRAYLSEQKAERRDLELFEVLRHPMWRVNMVIGDPAGMGAKVASAADTLAGLWRSKGIPLYYNYDHRFFATRIEATRRVLGYTELASRNTPRLNLGLSMIAFPEVKEDTQSRAQMAEGWVHHPIHSHPVSAWEYFCCFDPHRYDTEEYEVDSPEARMEMVQEQNGKFSSPVESMMRRIGIVNRGRYDRRRGGY